MSETPETPKTAANPAAKPAAKPAPKPKLEDKPFQAFIKDDLIPSLSKALSTNHQITASIDLIEGDRPVVESGTEPSLLESFLIDEKRINLALLQSRLLQRLNGQKWLGGN